MWKRPQRTLVTDRIDAARAAARRQGHELSCLQQGILEAITAVDPSHVSACRAELETIATALRQEGRWVREDEWRISTWSTVEIVVSMEEQTPVYEVTVTCEGQTLSCMCPTLERAYSYARLYQAIIVEQFYAIGPPWSTAAKSQS